jgi:hypothetical protein
MISRPRSAAPSAKRVSLEARANREYLQRCREGRFADDSIVGDCVACGSNLSAFAAQRKADNLIDCGRIAVQGASADSMQAATDIRP